MGAYIIQVIAFQLIFLMTYEVFLKKETFFNYNRWYLLFTSLISVLLPFVKIESFAKAIPSKYVITLPEVVIGNVKNTQQVTNTVTEISSATTSFFTINNFLIIGSCVALFIFIYKLIYLLKLILKAKKIRAKDYKVLMLPNTNVAFSFFNYVFIGNQLTDKEQESILAHELVHVKHKHSIDLLWFELLKIAFWFNPLVYIYKNHLSQVHEYIADQKALKSINKKEYYQRLLQQIFDVKTLPFINPFFKQSLIKKRIIMLQKTKSKPVYLIKYLLLIPMVVGMLVYSSCSKDETNKINTEETTLTEEELVQKYIEEFKNKYEHPLDAITDENTFKNENYLNTLDEYAKRKAAFILMSNFFEDKNGKKPVFSDKFGNQTYQDYLKRKATQEAKDQWTNSPKRGTLRLLVEDLDHMTANEKALMDSKIAQINKEDWYHALIISDGFNHQKITIREERGDYYLDEEQQSNVVDVPFSVIDQSPLFEACKDLQDNEAQKTCFSDNINNHVQQNFNTKLANSLGLEKGVKRIFIAFKIDTNGEVTDIRARAPHPDLEAEAIRVIKLLPKIIPGKQDGKVVNVPYSLPITFKID